MTVSNLLYPPKQSRLIDGDQNADIRRCHKQPTTGKVSYDAHENRKCTPSDPEAPRDQQASCKEEIARRTVVELPSAVLNFSTAAIVEDL